MQCSIYNTAKKLIQKLQNPRDSAGKLLHKITDLQDPPVKYMITQGVCDLFSPNNLYHYIVAYLPWLSFDGYALLFIVAKLAVGAAVESGGGSIQTAEVMVAAVGVSLETVFRASHCNNTSLTNKTHYLIRVFSKHEIDADWCMRLAI